MPVVLPVGHFDAAPTDRAAVAPVTAAFAALCVAVFVGVQAQGHDVEWTWALGAVPAEVLSAEDGTARGVLSLATSLVAHASWAHLFYNLVALWVFGAAVERSLGAARTFALYLGVGVAATLVEAAVSAAPTVPIVGASGVVAAAAGAFAVGYPRSRVVVAALFLTVPVPAWVALGLWAAVELMAGGGGEGIAHAAHLSGFALGALAMRVARIGVSDSNAAEPHV